MMNQENTEPDDLNQQMKEVYKWNTAVISCADKLQEQNENIPVRTDINILRV